MAREKAAVEFGLQKPLEGGRNLDRRFFYPVMLSPVGGLVGGTLSNLVVGAHPASASRSPRVVEAEVIEVVDKMGKPRIMLSTYACDDAHPGCPNEGMANVILLDQLGKPRVGLSSGRLNEG